MEKKNFKYVPHFNPQSSELAAENQDLKDIVKSVQSEIEDTNRKLEETNDNLNIEKSKYNELQKINENLEAAVSIFFLY